MNARMALAAALLALYAGSLRLTGQGLQGNRSAARDWALAHDADWTAQQFESIYTEVHGPANVSSTKSEV